MGADCHPYMQRAARRLLDSLHIDLLSGFQCRYSTALAKRVWKRGPEPMCRRQWQQSALPTQVRTDLPHAEVHDIYALQLQRAVRPRHRHPCTLG